MDNVSDNAKGSYQRIEVVTEAGWRRCVTPLAGVDRLLETGTRTRKRGDRRRRRTVGRIEGGGGDGGEPVGARQAGRDRAGRIICVRPCLLPLGTATWSAGYGRREDAQRQIALLNARSAAIASIMRASEGALESSAAA